MAAMLDDSSSSRARGLGVSKSKISKLRRNGGGNGGPHQRPPPTVYKTEPEGFRSLVQELTGPSPNRAAFLDSGGHFGGGGGRTSRIRSLAPPPLVSTPQPVASILSPKFPKVLEAFPSSSPKFTFAPFSPLADFSPREFLWAAGLESPGTADMKTLAHLVGREDPTSSKLDRSSSFSFSSFSNSNNGDFAFA